MNSIRFPNMFEGNSTKVVKDKAASNQDLKLLLGSEKGELFGDPFLGIRIKKYTFNQHSYILKDILIDEIYTQIKVFAPQLDVNRHDIKIIQRGNKAVAIIKAINKIDFTTDMYDLALFQVDER